MPSKRFKVEEIIRKLREAEVEQANGRTVPQACKKIGIAVSLEAEVPSREAFGQGVRHRKR